MINNIESLYVEKQHEFIKQYMKMIISFSLIHVLLHNILLFYKLTFFPIIIYVIFFLISILAYLFVEKILKIKFKILVYSQIILFSILIFIGNYLSYPKFPIALFYLLPFPFAIYMVESFKISLISTFVIFAIVILNFFFWGGSYEHVPRFDIAVNIGNWFTYLYILDFFLPIIESAFVIFLISYYIGIFHKIKAQKEILNLRTSKALSKEKIDKSNEPLEVLYQNVMIYLEKSKPFLNPHYTIQELTEALNSNRTYISNSINKVGNTNFKDLMNELRIKIVLKDIEDKKYEKFTIKYLFTQAGFDQQTRFNRAFRKVTGKSPSEYIKSLEKLEK
ncbi:helix-turn-helix domain-containing protein [Chryseobacterium sp. SL1]|uniref:helix-turn-helix domain-containing protein n=1 Tax=Chryseobacterium sp. SL1 TaxID=2995159 RepID=UPI002275197D|nr:helix-turn-helix domain-containing protein [Chryseobacterium sp. SL1]MCY1661941.1 helix-turn-helix domain-containing protein [Chryseobacterium sp. SL1]